MSCNQTLHPAIIAFDLKIQVCVHENGVFYIRPCNFLNDFFIFVRHLENKVKKTR